MQCSERVATINVPEKPSTSAAPGSRRGLPWEGLRQNRNYHFGIQEPNHVQPLPSYWYTAASPCESYHLYRGFHAEAKISWKTTSISEADFQVQGVKASRRARSVAMRSTSLRKAGPILELYKKFSTLLDLCVSSLRRGHANLLCIVPILTDDPRRESTLGVA